MRKKKFRKITEKNIASIYGKINGLRYTCYNCGCGLLFRRSFDVTTITSGVDYMVGNFPVSGIDVSLIKNDGTIDINITYQSPKSNYSEAQFNLSIGTKVALTGSEIRFKYDGVNYSIAMVTRTEYSVAKRKILILQGQRERKWRTNPITITDEENPLQNERFTVPESLKDQFTDIYGYPNYQGCTKTQIASVYGEFYDPAQTHRMLSEKFIPQENDFTEDDLPPIEDVSQGVSELEQHIGKQNRSMEFKLPESGWESKSSDDYRPKWKKTSHLLTGGLWNNTLSQTGLSSITNTGDPTYSPWLDEPNKTKE